MKIADIPFGITDWSAVERTEHPGDERRRLGMVHTRQRRHGDVAVARQHIGAGTTQGGHPAGLACLEVAAAKALQAPGRLPEGES